MNANHHTDWHLTSAVMHEQGRGDPFAAAIRATRMPMVITDPRQADNPIIFANEAFEKLTGYTHAEIVGRNCRFLQGEDTDKSTVDKIRAAIAKHEDIHVDILNYRKDGSTFWNALYLSPVRNKAGDIEFFFASQLDVTERIETQRLISEQKSIVEHEVRRRTVALEEALQAKTLLLHEVDHRVKNNLNMISSLLRLQTKTIDDPAIRTTLNDMTDRVEALASVHRTLYLSENISQFELGRYASALAKDLLALSDKTHIELVDSIQDIYVSAKNAAPLGLVLNEILTNALKHGFDGGGSGQLHLTAGPVDKVTGMIEIRDQGGKAQNPKDNTTSLGWRLIERLTKQANGRVSWEHSREGMCVRLEFPLEATE